MNWPFPDSPDVVVFTSKSVIENGDWIHYVSHDEADGAWQFHSLNGKPEAESDARLVLLRNMLKKRFEFECDRRLTGWLDRVARFC